MDNWYNIRVEIYSLNELGHNLESTESSDTLNGAMKIATDSEKTGMVASVIGSNTDGGPTRLIYGTK